MKILKASYSGVGSVNRDGSPSLPAGEGVHIVRLVRVRSAPKAVPLARFRRWRWGVRPDPRNAIGRNEYGYTFTRWGALREIAARIQIRKPRPYLAPAIDRTLRRDHSACGKNPCSDCR